MGLWNVITQVADNINCDYINHDNIKRLLLYFKFNIPLPFISRSSPSICATSEPSHGEASKNKSGKKRGKKVLKAVQIIKSRLMVSQ